MGQSPSAQLMAIRDKIDRVIISGVKQRVQTAAKSAEDTAKEVVTNGSPSAPGSPPGVRSGGYRAGMKGEGRVTGESARSVSVQIQVKNGVAVSNGHLLSDYLEHGTSKMAARPHFQKSSDQAEPKMTEIFGAPYYG